MAPQPRLDEERPRPQRPVQRRPLRTPESASGGLRRGLHLRAGRSGPQSLTASGKIHPRYDRMRRGVLLPQNTQTKCVAGRYTQAGLGAGGTAAFIIPGLGVAAQIGVSVPPGTEMRGFQFYGSLQGNAMLGLGAYLGAGLSAGGGHSNGPLPTGISGSGSWYGEGDIGAGPSLSISHQSNSSGSSTSAGIPFLPAKFGLGAGAYAGGGGAYNITVATPPIGCHP